MLFLSLYYIDVVCSFVILPTARYVYYFENDNPTIQARFLTGLVALINEQLVAEVQMEASVNIHYQNTLGNLFLTKITAIVELIIYIFTIQNIYVRGSKAKQLKSGAQLRLKSVV